MPRQPHSLSEAVGSTALPADEKVLWSLSKNTQTAAAMLRRIDGVGLCWFYLCGGSFSSLYVWIPSMKAQYASTSRPRSASTFIRS